MFISLKLQGSPHKTGRLTHSMRDRVMSVLEPWPISGWAQVWGHLHLGRALETHQKHRGPEGPSFL